MELRKHFKTLAIVSLLVGLLLASFPALASATTYYHYTVDDMDINKGDWDSDYWVRRMYFHPSTPGGPGASIQSFIPYQWKTDPWTWFPLYGNFINGLWWGEQWTDVGSGYWVRETVLVYRVWSYATVDYKATMHYGRHVDPDAPLIGSECVFMLLRDTG